MIEQQRSKGRFYELPSQESLSLLKEGTPVKVSSVENFQGFKLGFYLKRCKKDGGYVVYLTANEDMAYREVCIVPERGDTILPIVRDTNAI